MLGGSAVANSVTGITSWPDQKDLLPVLSAGLTAAIAWNYITRRLRLPSSSTHALFGGILGSVFAGSLSTKFIVWGAPNDIIHATGVWKIGLSLFLSPLCGFIAGYFMLSVVNVLLARATNRINQTLKALQWITVAVLAFSHGANDAQKAMGIILLGLHALGLSNGLLIPLSVRLACACGITLGVLSLTPGIVKRVGTEIYRLRPVHGLMTQIASATVILTASLIGGPVSTTQVISSSVMGVGGADRIKGVRWLAAKEMLIAWFLTIPLTALLAFLIYWAIFQWSSHLLVVSGS